MFQETAMVRARKELEKMYDGRCTVTEYQKYTKPNKSTGFQEVVVLSDEPCRLSFVSSPKTEPQDSYASEMTQTIKVFIAPEINVKAGSKLTITQHGVTNDYKSSGVPIVHATHQEIILELFEGWA